MINSKYTSNDLYVIETAIQNQQIGISGYRKGSYGNHYTRSSYIALNTVTVEKGNNHVATFNGKGIIKQKKQAQNFTFSVSNKGLLSMALKTIKRDRLPHEVKRHGNIRLSCNLYKVVGTVNDINKGLSLIGVYDSDTANYNAPLDIKFQQTLEAGEYVISVTGKEYLPYFSNYGSLGSFNIEGDHDTSMMNPLLRVPIYMSFAHMNRIGQPFSYVEGNHNAANTRININGFYAHSTSSFGSIQRNVPGYEAELYEGKDCSGRSLVLYDTDEDLSDNPFDTFSGWDQHVQSIAVRKARSATAYQGTNYGQGSVPLIEGEYDQYTLESMGLDSASLSSLNVRHGYEAQLYSGDDFTGPSLLLTADVPNLATKAFPTVGTWDNRARSLIVRKIGTPVVTAFNDCNSFTANPIPLTEGAYTASDLQARGLSLKSLSSLKVTAGYEAMLYARDTFQGDFKSITANRNCLDLPPAGEVNWNDKAASLIVRKYQPTAVTLFNDCNNFTTAPVPLTEGFYTVAALKARGLDSATLSSLKVNAGYEAVLYAQDDLEGDSLVVNANTDCLETQGWNDRASSLWVRALPKAVGWVYENANYNNGIAGLALPTGSYNMAALSAKGIANDVITSLKVDSGYEMVLYQNDNFSGDSLILAANNTDLSTYALGSGNWDNQVTSLRIRQAAGSATAQLYHRIFFAGNQTALASGSYTKTALAARGLANDSLNSLKIAPGYEAVLYEHDNFTGDSLILTGNAQRLDAYASMNTTGWDKKTTSLRISAAPMPVVSTTGGANAWGPAPLLPQGNYNYAALRGRGINNFGITSLTFLEKGYEAVLYSGLNFDSDSVVVPGGTLPFLNGLLTSSGSQITVHSLRIRTASPDMAIAYTDCSYSGSSARLPQGTYPLLLLRAMGIGNDTLSSLRVASGYEAVLFDNSTLNGDSLIIGGDNACLTDQAQVAGFGNWNDRTSSLVIRPSATAVATVYRNTNYGGSAAALPAGNYTMAALKTRGMSNDQIRSMNITSAAHEVVLYEHDNFTGDSLVRRGSFADPNLANTPAAGGANWAARATSLRIRAASVAQIFTGIDYRGTATKLPIGNYTMATLAAKGISDKTIRSLALEGGYRMVLYRNDNFTGDSLTFIGHEDNPNLANNLMAGGANWSAQASSLRLDVAGADVIRLYEDCYGIGSCISLPEGVFLKSDMQKRGYRDNSNSSIDVVPGYRVISYQDEVNQGASFPADLWSPCLTAMQYSNGAVANDASSAYKVFRKPTSGLNRISGTGTDETAPAFPSVTDRTQRMLLSPNPATERFTLSVQQPANITVTNLQGQVILMRRVETGQTIIDCSGWSTGLYLVRNNNTGEVLRFSKQ